MQRSLQKRSTRTCIDDIQKQQQQHNIHNIHNVHNVRPSPTRSDTRSSDSLLLDNNEYNEYDEDEDDDDHDYDEEESTNLADRYTSESRSTSKQANNEMNVDASTLFIFFIVSLNIYFGYIIYFFFIF